MQDHQGPVNVVLCVVQVRGEPKRHPPVRHLDPPLPQPGVQDLVPRAEAMGSQRPSRATAGKNCFLAKVPGVLVSLQADR